MSTPLEFLYHFRDLLRERGVRFAITSGMACVYYGLQQNTKDSDWIIEPEDLPKVRDLLAAHERRVPPWRISYRPIFGAPLETEWLAAGWTSHLAVWPTAGGGAEHLDFFGKAPRVCSWTTNEAGFAVREVVAMMKRTDRDKDWPIVDGLGSQLAGLGQLSEALVHLRDEEALIAARWQASEDEFARAVARRPLLALIDESIDPDTLAGWLRIERLIWECVNRERHRRYQKAWKEFYRAWRRESDWDWPSPASFEDQHARVLQAVADHGLPLNPLAEISAADLVNLALERAAKIAFTTEDQLQRVCPPTEEMLPPA